MSKKELTVDERINKEKKRLNKIFEHIEEDKFKIAKGLIENAAFMKIQMELMTSRINVDGVTIQYQNGENQWGYKKSPDVETYNSFIKQYTAIIKQLTDLLPKEQAIDINPLEALEKAIQSYQGVLSINQRWQSGSKQKSQNTI